jgi:8-oxo-dGTP pyrophosphatase MutT (NUDIX family)
MVARPAEETAPEGAYQVFMVRRSTKSTFVPDVYVFPGGSLEASDSSPDALDRLAGITPAEIARIFRDTPGVGADADMVAITPEQIAGLHLAALRELFEEAGVLLVQDEQGNEFEIGRDPARRAHFHAARKAMQNNELSFLQLLEREKLKADAGRLIYFSHWITPPSEHRRFDTRFFLATVDFGHEAEADEYETTQGVWIEPGKALELFKQKQFNMIFPTIAHLKRLAARPTLPALREYARTKEIVPAMPEVRPGPTFKLADEVFERW